MVQHGVSFSSLVPYGLGASCIWNMNISNGMHGSLLSPPSQQKAALPLVGPVPRCLLILFCLYIIPECNQTAHTEGMLMMDVQERRHSLGRVWAKELNRRKGKKGTVHEHAAVPKLQPWNLGEPGRDPSARPAPLTTSPCTEGCGVVQKPSPAVFARWQANHPKQDASHTET